MTTNTNTRELVYLAGLLHDIGKFYPDVDTLWQDHPYYHQLKTEEKNYIVKANIWATRLDQQNDRSIDAQEPLHNLFNEIQIQNKIGSTEKRFGFHPLSLDAEVVLQKAPGDLVTLRQRFAADFNKLPTGAWTAFTESFYHLLRQYTWCIPASEQPEFKAVSLFHHLKLTAAFAQCLYDYDVENEDNKSLLPLQLLCVDLSGIQSFIYNIGSKYAAKSLKGRSFSLQLLLDGVARKLIQDTQATPSHLVYSSGGKFFMLLPNTAKVSKSLWTAEQAIQKAIWAEFQGNLFVCFGRVAFDYAPDAPEAKAIRMEAETGSLSDLWKQVTRKAADQKVQKNKALILDPNNFKNLFGASGEGGDKDQCAVTGWEGNLIRVDDNTRVHKTVQQQIEIGRKLANARFITTGDGPLQLLSETLAKFDLADRTTFPKKAEYSQIIQPGLARSFLETSDNTLIHSFRFYGGSQQALSIHGRDQPKTFEELAGIIREEPDDEKSAIKHREGNYNRLAVLRMDVDSLGELFTKGLTSAKATFSAYATLSGLLDWFFSGYLNTIRAQYADWVNIIYSGGDDVFAVGRWDKIISFADQIQHDFKAFTGRPDLTISAGIVLMRPRYPIGKAADQAGEAEDIAKDHTHTGQTKNAVCLFGLAANWDSEWPFVKEYHQKFVAWLTDGTLSKGILQKLFAYYDIYANSEAERKAAERRKQANSKIDLSWKWNAAYTLSRHRTDKNKDVIDELKLLLFTRINEDGIRFEALAMAMRWAELTVRDKITTKPNDNGTNNR